MRLRSWLACADQAATVQALEEAIQVQVPHQEPARGFEDCEVRLGQSSWDDSATSVKFAARDSRGQVSRTGEVPIEALPQMLEVAIRVGGLTLR